MYKLNQSETLKMAEFYVFSTTCKGVCTALANYEWGRALAPPLLSSEIGCIGMMYRSNPQVSSFLGYNFFTRSKLQIYLKSYKATVSQFIFFFSIRLGYHLFSVGMHILQNYYQKCNQTHRPFQFTHVVGFLSTCCTHSTCHYKLPYELVVAVLQNR